MVAVANFLKDHPLWPTLAAAVVVVLLMEMVMEDPVAMAAQELFTSFTQKHHKLDTHQVGVLLQTAYVKFGTTQPVTKT
jgi:hypothetical protein